MAKYCSNCGSEVDEKAVVCIKCGCAIKKENNYENCLETTTETPKTGLILGVLGIIFAWLFAIIGHALSIIGIIVGIKEYKSTNKMTGLILSIVGEVCAIFSSMLGVVLGSALF